MARTDRASTPAREHTTDAPPSRTDTDRRTAKQAPGAGADDYGWLPDDAEPRTYIELRPAGAPLDHAAVEAAMCRLVPRSLAPSRAPPGRERARRTGDDGPT